MLFSGSLTVKASVAIEIEVQVVFLSYQRVMYTQFGTKSKANQWMKSGRSCSLYQEKLKEVVIARHNETNAIRDNGEHQ